VAAATPAAPLAQGSVQLAISPWGQVEVDGKPAGTTPPLTRLTLPEGTHTITVRNEDFPPLQLTIQVAEDKPVTVRHRFGSGS
jgi:serine/threonine-protein kinase